MKTWRVPAGARIDGLRLGEEASVPLAGPGQVRVRVKRGFPELPGPRRDAGLVPDHVRREPLVPGSDAVGEVVEARRGVTRFQWVTAWPPSSSPTGSTGR